MKLNYQKDTAFTLLELLAAVAIIAILAAVLLPALNATKASAKRTACMSNLKQLNAGFLMCCDDASDATSSQDVWQGGRTWGPWIGYKERMKNYVGLQGHSSPQDKIFACPADTFHYNESRDIGIYFTNAPMHQDSRWDYASYWFNGFNLNPHTADGQYRLGIGGLKLSSIKEPTKTVLLAEAPTFYPFSWHQPPVPLQLAPGQWPQFPGAKDVVSFVDGHASYIKIYWNEESSGWMACFYNPPAGYDYKWSGD